jgi:hypothetical protein
MYADDSTAIVCRAVVVARCIWGAKSLPAMKSHA